jgi:cell division protein FtsL
MFQFASNDPQWGKGAVGDIRKRLVRHRPFYAPILPNVPFISGILFAIPISIIVLAFIHETEVTGLLVVVVALSLLLMAANSVIWRRYQKRRAFVHTVIAREARERSWSWIKVTASVVAGVAAFAANVASLIVLLTR